MFLPSKKEMISTAYFKVANGFCCVIVLKLSESFLVVRRVSVNELNSWLVILMVFALDGSAVRVLSFIVVSVFSKEKLTFFGVNLTVHFGVDV